MAQILYNGRKVTPKSGGFCSRDPFLSAQLWTYKKICHRTLLDGINKIDDGPLFKVTFDGRR